MIKQLETRNAELERLVANRDESIHNLVKVLDKRQERMRELGIEVDG